VASTIIYIIAAAVICILVGLNVCVMFNTRKARIIGFIGGTFMFPVIIGSICALVLIEKDMELSRFLVGCMLISAGTIGYIYGMCHLAEKAEAK
jgi:hypothetical protein